MGCHAHAACTLPQSTAVSRSASETWRVDGVASLGRVLLQIRDGTSAIAHVQEGDMLGMHVVNLTSKPLFVCGLLVEEAPGLAVLEVLPLKGLVEVLPHSQTGPGSGWLGPPTVLPWGTATLSPEWMAMATASASHAGGSVAIASASASASTVDVPVRVHSIDFSLSGSESCDVVGAMSSLCTLCSPHQP